MEKTGILNSSTLAHEPISHAEEEIVPNLFDVI